MEIRARFFLIGLFTLAVIATGFGFVYWLNTAGGLGQRTLLTLRYDSPVAGLLKGSAVLFNGVRVGEVTVLTLDPGKPGEVLVEVAIARQTPVRADTRVGIDFQGLTGAPVVALSGGTATLPLLSAGPDRPPILQAEKDAGLGMAQAARDVLRRIDEVVAENSEPLRKLIANINTFSEALARNSDRVDGIVSGIERFTGAVPRPPVQIYDLPAAKEFPGVGRIPDRQISIAEPSALNMLDNERIMVVRQGAAESAVFEDARWPDMLPRVVQARLLKSFEVAGFTRAIGRVPDVVQSEAQILTEVRKFNVVVLDTMAAEIELAARILSSEGAVMATAVFSATQPLSDLTAPEAARAIGAAFQKAAAELVVWAAAKL